MDHSPVLANRKGWAYVLWIITGYVHFSSSLREMMLLDDESYSGFPMTITSFFIPFMPNWSPTNTFICASNFWISTDNIASDRQYHHHPSCAIDHGYYTRFVPHILITWRQRRSDESTFQRQAYVQASATTRLVLSDLRSRLWMQYLFAWGLTNWLHRCSSYTLTLFGKSTLLRHRHLNVHLR